MRILELVVPAHGKGHLNKSGQREEQGFVGGGAEIQRNRDTCKAR